MMLDALFLGLSLVIQGPVKIPVPPAMPVVIVEPDEPGPGNTLRIISTIKPEGCTIHVRFMGKTCDAWQTGKFQYMTLIGLDANVKPGKYRMEVEAVHGRSNATASLVIRVKSRTFPVQHINLSKKKSDLYSDPGTARARKIIRRAKKTKTSIRRWKGVFIKPVNSKITSVYGLRRSYNNRPSSSYHKGVDLRAALGEPVRATNNGIVILARNFPLEGGLVLLDHGQGILSTCFHLSRIDVIEGEHIAQGDIIGLAGNTGISTAPHVHWSLYVNGVDVDPLEWTRRIF